MVVVVVVGGEYPEFKIFFLFQCGFINIHFKDLHIIMIRDTSQSKHWFKMSHHS